jgi:hypothetical protein
VERRFYGLSKQLAFEKERADEMTRHVGKRAVVGARTQENMPWKQRTRIKECDYFVIFIDDGGNETFGGDFAESAICRKGLFARSHAEIRISAGRVA